MFSCMFPKSPSPVAPITVLVGTYDYKIDLYDSCFRTGGQPQNSIPIPKVTNDEVADIKPRRTQCFTTPNSLY